MSNGNGFYVDPASMRSAADAAESAGHGLAQAGAGATDSIEQAADAHTGMLAAIALSHAVERWSQKMAMIGEQTAEVAGKVRDTLAEIDVHEQAATTEFRGLAGPL